MGDDFGVVAADIRALAAVVRSQDVRVNSCLSNMQLPAGFPTESAQAYIHTRDRLVDACNAAQTALSGLAKSLDWDSPDHPGAAQKYERAEAALQSMFRR